MKIASLHATWVHVPIPSERQHASDFGRIASFDSVVVKVETDGGLVGWGEAKAGVGSAASGYGLAAIINRDYAPLLVGQDPRDVSRLWDVMYNTPREGYTVERGHVLPQLGRRGLSISAIAGVDIALWDLLGKSLGAPVWRLLGGRRAERMPAYEIPVTYVMLNNAAYRILKLNMVEYLGTAARGRRFVAMDLTDPELRFDRMAEAMGVHGRRVQRPEDLGPALREAIAHDGPSLVDVAMESPVPLP